MTYEETAKEIVDRLFCKGCEADCYESGKCCWLTIKDALEKQIPKKTVETKYFYRGCCPCCGEYIVTEHGFPKHCEYCGQSVYLGDE